MFRVLPPDEVMIGSLVKLTWMLHTFGHLFAPDAVDADVERYAHI